jgi:hypothetical protein
MGKKNPDAGNLERERMGGPSASWVCICVCLRQLDTEHGLGEAHDAHRIRIEWIVSSFPGQIIPRIKE